MKQLVIIACCVALSLMAGASGFDKRQPRPTGYAEAGVAGEASRIAFERVDDRAGLVYDTTAHFPHEAAPEFEVKRVAVNGAEAPAFVVRNRGIFNGNRRVHGTEDFSVSVYTGWEPGREYCMLVAGVTSAGTAVALEVKGQADDKSSPLGLGFKPPSGDFPYHSATMTLPRETAEPGAVVKVELDGKRLDGKFCSYVRCFNVGIQDPRDAGQAEGLEGETYTGRIDGSRDFQVVVPCDWVNGSEHTLRVTVALDAGEEEVYEAKGTAPGKGGYWNSAWPHSVSIALEETVGLLRQGEPVHLSLGLFADDVKDPAEEIRVVTYAPKDPKAGDDGYVVAPCQVTSVAEWRDAKMLDHEERDAETGELVHRYDPATTVDLVFLADVLPYEKKVYQVLYGNPDAEALPLDTDLKVEQLGDKYAQGIETSYYRMTTALKSGAVETVTVLGEGAPVLLEHKLETNGAVHWNPGVYAPPTPWVHASDWEWPALEQISGPIMHRTRRYAPLPHMDEKAVTAGVSYTFYAGQPYVLMSSIMEVQRDMFVKAIRNGEIVFNHAVLDEFVWMDPLGQVQSLPLGDTKKHPIHALEVPQDTPWMAFVSREHGVGFASIALAYENTNRYGDPASEAQPYIYVQVGPWIYWSRAMVYPFGGQNLTRVMRARKGSIYLEENAWVPFRLAEGDDPFAEIERLTKQLTHPLEVSEWMNVDDRTPEKWVMPILTMPFDEGVAGAVSAHKEKKEQ